MYADLMRKKNLAHEVWNKVKNMPICTCQPKIWANAQEFY